VLVNVMDDVPNCDFASPAVVRRGELVLAISTGGRSPALARKVREELERRFGAEWAELLEVLRDVRRRRSRSSPTCASGHAGGTRPWTSRRRPPS
jgi:precorrin-2 dehydrogenase/sirohydrochlorin ferrochelatase